MALHENLCALRKKNGYSQEDLAYKLGIARQTVGKWENGQAVPELSGLLKLSEIYGVTIDHIVKGQDGCGFTYEQQSETDKDSIILFLIRGKQKTYAGKGRETESARPASHDLKYQEGEYLYYDTYLGGENFSGEEGIWIKNIPVWCMNYSGRVIGEGFSGDFLKKALLNVTEEMPYRGPCIYTEGEYHYHCRVEGDFFWFQGYEEIFYGTRKIYECLFHGGKVK